jgi:hypothetical protein
MFDARMPQYDTIDDNVSSDFSFNLKHRKQHDTLMQLVAVLINAAP